MVDWLFYKVIYLDIRLVEKLPYDEKHKVQLQGALVHLIKEYVRVF